MSLWINIFQSIRKIKHRKLKESPVAVPRTREEPANCSVNSSWLIASSPSRPCRLMVKDAIEKFSMKNHMPTGLLESCIDQLVPYITSFMQGRQSWGLGVATLQMLGWGSWGVRRGGRRGVVDGFRKKYSVYCTESMLENVFFYKKNLL